MITGVLTRATIRMFPLASLDNGALSFASRRATTASWRVSGRRLWRGRSGGGQSDDLCADGDQSRRLGLTLTDGTAITLSLVSGQIIGMVGADAANTGLTGKVAFAIAIDPPTGEVVRGAVSVAAPGQPDQHAE